MVYIGVDQSFSGTGLCAIDASGEVISTEKLVGQPVSDKGIRNIVELIMLFREELFDTNKDARFTVCIEEPAMSQHGSSSYQQLCCLFGVLRHVYYAATVNPRSWQSKITHNQLKGINKKTNAGVKAYLLTVYAQTGNMFDDVDVADAYCIAEYKRRLDLGQIEPPKAKAKRRRKTRPKTG